MLAPQRRLACGMLANNWTLAPVGVVKDYRIDSMERVRMFPPVTPSTPAPGPTRVRGWAATGRTLLLYHPLSLSSP